VFFIYPSACHSHFPHPRKPSFQIPFVVFLFLLLTPPQYGQMVSPTKTHVEPLIDFTAFAIGAFLITRFELSTLAFNTLDTDRSGFLDREEIFSIVEKVYSNSTARLGPEFNVPVHTATARARIILNGMDVDDDGQVRVTKELSIFCSFLSLVRRLHIAPFQALSYCHLQSLTLSSLVHSHFIHFFLYFLSDIN
jgi:hypothetical protein